MNDVIEALVMKRVYPHPREVIFRAWTEPKRLEKWFSPNPKNRVEAEIDLRVGGQYRIAMIPESGDAWVVGGEYREIVRPEKLVFTWRWVSDPTDTEGTLITLEFFATESGTEMSLTHSNLESEESYNGHKEGWIACLVRLDQYLEDPMEALTETSTDLVSAAAQIKQARQVAELALNRLRDTFAHVPDDKLAWSPGDSCRTPLVILGHTAYANLYFAAILRGTPPAQTPNQAIQEGEEKSKKMTARAEANELFERTTSEVLQAFDQLDPARLLTDPQAGFILTLVGRHVDGHAAQIDYLQTIWGDQEDHFGM